MKSINVFLNEKLERVEPKSIVGEWISNIEKAKSPANINKVVKKINIFFDKFQITQKDIPALKDIVLFADFHPNVAEGTIQTMNYTIGFIRYYLTDRFDSNKWNLAQPEDNDLYNDLHNNFEDWNNIFRKDGVYMEVYREHRPFKGIDGYDDKDQVEDTMFGTLKMFDEIVKIKTGTHWVGKEWDK